MSRLMCLRSVPLLCRAKSLECCSELRIAKALLILFLVQLVGAAHADDSPLTHAKSLAAGQFKDFGYSTDPQKAKTTDCTRFLLAVVASVNGKPLSDPARARLVMSDIKPDAIKQLVEGNDPKTKGVQAALVDAHLGVAVDPKDAVSGDLIQYWMQQEDGTWFGHSAVLEEVTKNGDEVRATLFGAHQSMGKIGTSDFKLKLTPQDAKRRIYIVRYQRPK